MTAMQILERCRTAESDKQAMRDRVRRYRESATRVTAALDGIRAGGNSQDKLAGIMAEIDQLERDIVQRDLEYAAEAAAACKLLDMLPENESKVLDRYYLNGNPLTAIARELSYSYGYVRTLKSSACLHLEAVPEAMVGALLPGWYIAQAQREEE